MCEFICNFQIKIELGSISMREFICNFQIKIESGSISMSEFICNFQIKNILSVGPLTNSIRCIAARVNQPFKIWRCRSRGFVCTFQKFSNISMMNINFKNDSKYFLENSKFPKLKFCQPKLFLGDIQISKKRFWYYYFKFEISKKTCQTFFVKHFLFGNLKLLKKKIK